MSTPATPWAKYASPGGQNPWEKYGAAPVTSSVLPAQPSMTQTVLGTAKDLGIGALKGAGQTATNIGSIVYPHWLERALTGKDASQDEAKLYSPTSTAQKIGKAGEQVGEFFVPGGAEDRVAEHLGDIGKATSLIKPAVRTIMGESVNEAQGGTPGMGAVGTAGGEAVGAGLRAVAPHIAESALGIPKAARAFGKTPGAAILNETRGIRPETIAQSAQERLGQLTPQLESAAAASPAKASLLPARHIVMDAGNKAASQNAEGLFNQLGKQGDFLSYGGPSGEVSPQKLLDLKRGFNEEHLRWNPEMHDRALSTGRQAYNALDQELDRTVPESAGLNQRISSLIPVTQRAESVSRNAPTIQRALGRFGAHTGALTLGGIGAAGGYKEGGLPGAVSGGLTGVLAPELISSPEGQMAVARSLNAVRGLRPAVGGALQIDRKKETK